MALVPKDYLTVETLRELKFNLKASCSICTEEFDCKVRIPKVLPCGHTFCVVCLGLLLNGLQVAHVGQGEVMTSLKCATCRQSFNIPSNGASGFPNNYQLMEATEPQDSRFLVCTVCKIPGIENAFHICRECTIEKHGFDVQGMLHSEPVVHPDTYVICSTCILKDHNTTGHTIITYAPLRLDYQFKKNMINANVLAAQTSEKFSEVRSILATIPILVEKKEAEVSKMVEMMQRGKTSQNQKLIFQLYKKEMGDINTILDVLRRDGGKLNEMVRTKVEILGKTNEEINSLHCLSEIQSLKEILKIPEVVPEAEEQPIELTEVIPEAAEPTEHVPDPLLVPSLELIDNGTQMPSFGTLLLKMMWEGAVWIYENLPRQSPAVLNGNNSNQEAVNDEGKRWMVLTVVVIFVCMLIKLFF